MDIKRLVRWVAVIPIALVCGILLTFPLHWIIVINFSDWLPDRIITMDKSDRDHLEFILSPLVIAFGFVVTGATIAPNYTFRVAVVLAAIHATAMTAIAVLYSQMTHFGWQTVGAVSGVSLGFALIWYKTKHQPQTGTT